MKNILITTCFAIFTCQTILAGCESCKVSKNEIITTKAAFISSINEEGSVNGYFLASCGMYNFGMNNKKCSLARQINEKAYNVNGSNIDDHEDSHAKDGFCNTIHVAKVSGQIKENIFIAKSF